MKLLSILLTPIRQLLAYIREVFSSSNEASMKRWLAFLSFAYTIRMVERGLGMPDDKQAHIMYYVQVFIVLCGSLMGISGLEKIPSAANFIKTLWRKKQEPQPDPVQPDPPAPEPEKPKPEVNILQAKLQNLLPPHAHRFAPHLAEAMHSAKIDTNQRIAHFLAQVAHESGEFKYSREIWGPTAAQKRYEGRKDLGNTQPGDGKLFMGRGLIQVTGRANYAECSLDLFNDPRLLHNPELLEQPEYAAKSAVWFWEKRNLNNKADTGADYATVLSITRTINGGTNGIKSRWALFQSYHSRLT